MTLLFVSLKKMLKLLTFAGLAIISSACQSRIAIFSNPPGADVYAGDSLLGKTPIRVDPAAIESVRTAGGYLLRVEKPGVGRIWVLAPEGKRKFEVRLKLSQFALVSALNIGAKDITVSQKTLDQEGPEVARRFQRDIADLMSLQAKTMRGETVSNTDLDKFKTTFPDAAGPWFLEGLNKYRSGDKKSAAETFKEALKRNAWDTDILSVVSEAEKGNGG